MVCLQINLQRKQEESNNSLLVMFARNRRMSSSMACTRTHDWSENHSWSSATRNDVNHPECFLKITGKGNDISNPTVGNKNNGRMSSSVRDLSENPRRLCALVRRCARCECVGSEICALNPPVLRAATLRQRRPCGRELGPHRATQGSSDHTTPCNTNKTSRSMEVHACHMEFANCRV